MDEESSSKSDGERKKSPKLNKKSYAWAASSSDRPSAEIMRVARNRTIGVNEVQEEPKWSVAKRALAKAAEAAGFGATTEQKEAALTSQVGSALATEYLDFFKKEMLKRQQPKQALHTCDQNCEYCQYRPCEEAYNHSTDTNWQMPHRCVLRQKGLACEMIDDDEAAMKAVIAGSMNDPSVSNENEIDLG